MSKIRNKNLCIGLVEFAKSNVLSKVIKNKILIMNKKAEYLSKNFNKPLLKNGKFKQE
jgi:hypothetical protein